MAMRNPPHPGTFLRDEVVDASGLSVTAAARVLGVARPTLSNLLNGRADLSPEMALRVEKAFGLRMDTLLDMQTAYNVAQMRQRAHEIDVRPYADTAAATR